MGGGDTGYGFSSTPLPQPGSLAQPWPPDIVQQYSDPSLSDVYYNALPSGEWPFAAYAPSADADVQLALFQYGSLAQSLGREIAGLVYYDASTGSYGITLGVAGPDPRGLDALSQQAYASAHPFALKGKYDSPNRVLVGMFHVHVEVPGTTAIVDPVTGIADAFSTDDRKAFEELAKYNRGQLLTNLPPAARRAASTIVSAVATPHGMVGIAHDPGRYHTFSVGDDKTGVTVVESQDATWFWSPAVLVPPWTWPFAFQKPWPPIWEEWLQVFPWQPKHLGRVTEAVRDRVNGPGEPEMQASGPSGDPPGADDGPARDGSPQARPSPPGGPPPTVQRGAAVNQQSRGGPPNGPPPPATPVPQAPPPGYALPPIPQQVMTLDLSPGPTFPAPGGGGDQPFPAPAPPPGGSGSAPAGGGAWNPPWLDPPSSTDSTPATSSTAGQGGVTWGPAAFIGLLLAGGLATGVLVAAGEAIAGLVVGLATLLGDLAAVFGLGKDSPNASPPDTTSKGSGDSGKDDSGGQGSGSADDNNQPDPKKDPGKDDSQGQDKPKPDPSSDGGYPTDDSSAPQVFHSSNPSGALSFLNALRQRRGGGTVDPAEDMTYQGPGSISGLISLWTYLQMQFGSGGRVDPAQDFGPNGPVPDLSSLWFGPTPQDILMRERAPQQLAWLELLQGQAFYDQYGLVGMPSMSDDALTALYPSFEEQAMLRPFVPQVPGPPDNYALRRVWYRDPYDGHLYWRWELYEKNPTDPFYQKAGANEMPPPPQQQPHWGDPSGDPGTGGGSGGGGLGPPGGGYSPTVGGSDGGDTPPAQQYIGNLRPRGGGDGGDLPRY